MKSIAQILANIDEKDAGKYVKYEWQLFAYRLANWLGDKERMSLYMKLAKQEDRKILQKSWDFVKESNPRSKPRLFLWKLAQLRKEQNAQAD